MSVLIYLVYDITRSRYQQRLIAYWKLYFNSHCQKCCTLLEPISISAANLEILTYFSTPVDLKLQIFVTQFSPWMPYWDLVTWWQQVNALSQSKYNQIQGIVMLCTNSRMFDLFWYFNPIALQHSLHPVSYLSTTIFSFGQTQTFFLSLALWWRLSIRLLHFSL